MMSEDKNIKEYVENKIVKITFKAKNFTQGEIDFVDEYCKARYDNNRKLMILDLIRYKEENVLFELLNEKINYLYDQINSKKEEPKKEKKVSWKGFGDN